MDLHKKLQELSSQESSTWLQEAEERKLNRSWQKRSAVIALRILRELRHKGLTQRDLAERMGVSAQQVNKIVKGQENMTLDTLDRLEKALSIHLLHDDKTQPVMVFGFQSIPIAQKMPITLRTFNQCSQLFHTGVTVKGLNIDSASALTYANDNHLHTRYPIPGKEKWLQLHAQLS